MATKKNDSQHTRGDSALFAGLGSLAGGAVGSVLGPVGARAGSIAGGYYGAGYKAPEKSKSQAKLGGGIGGMFGPIGAAVGGYAGAAVGDTKSNPKKLKGRWEHVGGGCSITPKKKGSKKRGPKYVCDDEYRNDSRGQTVHFVSTPEAHFSMPQGSSRNLRGVPRKGAKKISASEALKRKLMR